MSKPGPAELHGQLASIMEVLANAAVAEICELVDGGYAVLHAELSRSHKESEGLRRKLRLMELKVSRVAALRAAGVGSSVFASSRARAAAAHLGGGEWRRSHGGELPLPRVTAQVPLLCGDPDPSGDTTSQGPLHTSGQGTLHTSQGPLHTSGQGPLHTSGQGALHTSGQGPLHTGQGALHTSGQGTLHTSQGPLQTGQGTLHNTSQGPLQTGQGTLHNTSQGPLQTGQGTLHNTSQGPLQTGQGTLHNTSQGPLQTGQGTLHNTSQGPLQTGQGTLHNTSQGPLQTGQGTLHTNQGPLHTKQTAAVNPVKIQTALIKVEKEEESWQQDKGFHDDVVHNADPGNPTAEAPPPLAKQEVVTKKDGAGGRPACAWEGAGPAPPLTPPLTKRSQSSGSSLGAGEGVEEVEPGYHDDGMLYEEVPSLPHTASSSSFLPGQDASPEEVDEEEEEEEPGCSYSDPAIRFPFSLGDEPPPPPHVSAAAGFPDGSQRAPSPPAEEALADGRKEAFSLQEDSWLAQDGFGAYSGGRDDPAGGKAFICSFCGKTLACLKNLKTHIRVHTGEKPFSCPLCGKRFSDSSNLKRHQSVHTGEKRYCCVHCGKRFAQSGSLKVHMSVHTGCKQFTCPYCSKTFISANHLRRHVLLHGPDKLLPTMF